VIGRGGVFRGLNQAAEQALCAFDRSRFARCCGVNQAITTTVPV